MRSVSAEDSDQSNMTPEWKNAVRRGSLNDLQRLAAAGADINARDEYGQSALMHAAVKGDDEVVEWLVERGAELDHAAKYGLSALMLAVVNGRLNVVRTLLRAGANLALRGTGAPGLAGKTALEIAIARDDKEMVKLLHGRDSQE